MKKLQYLPFIVLVIVPFIFFRQFFIYNLLPVPADTIIGLYHPFRDLYAKEYPNGIPYKNFLITDPVRQQYPWRNLAVSLERSGVLPLWNPYTFAGTPLLANFQTAALYPFNILLFILPFSIGWSLLIFSQPFLAGIFLYMYLRHMKLSKAASLLGGITFAFCGFSVAWLEWGTIGQVALWLPLILLSIDKLVSSSKQQVLSIHNNRVVSWSIIYSLSLTSAFLAGHLQTFFYLFLVSAVYFFVRWFQYKREKNILLLFLLLASCFLLLTFIQWYPLWQFISLSARNVDQIDWHQPGWFIPWQHLLQFIAPDFFGNPTTLNYWGVWNYGELVGYVGIFPLIVGSFALFFRKDKKTLFFGTVFFLSLIFSLPTIFARLPYVWHVPLLSTSQPTRLLFLTDFSLAVLSALGLDFFLRTEQKKKLLFPVAFIAIVFVGLWVFVTAGNNTYSAALLTNLSVAEHNLYVPTTIFVFVTLVLVAMVFIKNKKSKYFFVAVLLVITAFDLLRFADKFIPFTNPSYLFPQTAALSYLQNQKGQFRIMTRDARILPPNFSAMYHLQSIDGYDPLYRLRYGEFIAAMGRNKPDINPPFGFNRIINPQNVDSRLIDLLGVKYVLSLSDLHSAKLKKVFSEGQTQIYENTRAFPRTLFIHDIKTAGSKQQAINELFDDTNNLKKTGIVEGWDNDTMVFGLGKAAIRSYSENVVTIKTTNDKTGFLVLVDSYYPTWHAKICTQGQIHCTETKIYVTDFNFRGIVVPSGKHTVVFYNTLL